MSAKKYLLLSLAHLQAKDYESAATLFAECGRQSDLDALVQTLLSLNGLPTNSISNSRPYKVLSKRALSDRKNPSDESDVIGDYAANGPVQIERDRIDDTAPEDSGLTEMDSVCSTPSVAPKRGRRWGQASIIKLVYAACAGEDPDTDSDSDSDELDSEASEVTNPNHAASERDTYELIKDSTTAIGTSRKMDSALDADARPKDNVASDFESDKVDADSNLIIDDSESGTTNKSVSNTSLSFYSDIISDDEEAQGQVSDLPEPTFDPDLPGAQLIPTSFSSDIV
jgi:hypothetical protein